MNNKLKFLKQQRLKKDHPDVKAFVRELIKYETENRRLQKQKPNQPSQPPANNNKQRNGLVPAPSPSPSPSPAAAARNAEAAAARNAEAAAAYEEIEKEIKNELSKLKCSGEKLNQPCSLREEHTKLMLESVIMKKLQVSGQNVIGGVKQLFLNKYISMRTNTKGKLSPNNRQKLIKEAVNSVVTKFNDVINTAINILSIREENNKYGKQWIASSPPEFTLLQSGKLNKNSEMYKKLVENKLNEKDIMIIFHLMNNRVDDKNISIQEYNTFMTTWTTKRFSTLKNNSERPPPEVDIENKMGEQPRPPPPGGKRARLPPPRLPPLRVRMGPNLRVRMGPKYVKKSNNLQ